MPRSKKGRLAGGARKEINETRATEAVAVSFMSEAERTAKHKVLDFTFGRVTKLTGANHARVAISSKHGKREVLVRIPNIFARRGATPITDRSVVTIHTGPDFDPDGVAETKSVEHYDITSILTARQICDLQKLGVVPEWMTFVDVSDTAIARSDIDGFVWDYGGAAAAADDEDAGRKRAKASHRPSAAAGAGDDSDSEDIDIGAI